MASMLPLNTIKAPSLLGMVRVPTGNAGVNVVVLDRDSKKNQTQVPHALPLERFRQALREAEEQGKLTLQVCESADEVDVSRGLPGGAWCALAWMTNSSEAEKLLRKVPDISWIHSSSAGVNHLLNDYVIDHPVVMTNSKGAYSDSLGEWAIFCCMYFAKKVGRMVRSQQDRKWDYLVVEEIRGKRMVVVGYGDIGWHCGVRARAFGMSVIGVRRRPELSADDGVADRVVGFDDLGAELAEADYVVCALPLTPATDGLFSKRHFAALKPSCVFVNVGRGATVDEEALEEVLRSEQIRGAGLDVFATEPLPSDHPFYGMENVLLSAHCADNTDNYNNMSLNNFLLELDRFNVGEKFQFLVDKKHGY
mmetsp:Transcript_34479/g.97257  ORF Transcript_34479/g.97257 Transcript_34479/m.97257 type:complete len:365 (+) Transcript_34479:46-1140(+)